MDVGKFAIAASSWPLRLVRLRISGIFTHLKNCPLGEGQGTASAQPESSSNDPRMDVDGPGESGSNDAAPGGSASGAANTAPPTPDPDNVPTRLDDNVAAEIKGRKSS